MHEDFLRAVQDLKKKSVEASGSRTNFFLHINAVDVSAPNRKKYSSLIGVHDPMEVIQVCKKERDAATSAHHIQLF